MSDAQKPHSEHLDVLRRFIGWKSFVEDGRPEDGDVPPDGPIPEPHEAAEALRGLVEQLESRERMLRKIYDAASAQMDADGRGWISAAWVEDRCATELRLGSWSTRASFPASEPEDV